MSGTTTTGTTTTERFVGLLWVMNSSSIWRISTRFALRLRKGVWVLGTSNPLIRPYLGNGYSDMLWRCLSLQESSGMQVDWTSQEISNTLRAMSFESY